MVVWRRGWGGCGLAWVGCGLASVGCGLALRSVGWRSWCLKMALRAILRFARLFLSGWCTLRQRMWRRSGAIWIWRALTFRSRSGGGCWKSLTVGARAMAKSLPRWGGLERAARSARRWGRIQPPCWCRAIECSRAPVNRGIIAGVRIESSRCLTRSKIQALI